jgi:sec-independent protein translocase protein TatB
MVILLVALIVLGPEKLPDAVRKTGRVIGELRKMSSGFQAELRDAFDEPYREVKGSVDSARQTLKDTATSVKSGFDVTPAEAKPTSSPSAAPAAPAPAPPELAAEAPESAPSAASAHEAGAPEGEGEPAPLAADDTAAPATTGPVPPGAPPLAP